jgi:hypothetical protein
LKMHHSLRSRLLPWLYIASENNRPDQCKQTSCLCNRENLYTFTKYSGYEPEQARLTTMAVNRIDLGNYPVPRSFVFGVNRILTHFKEKRRWKE